MKKVISVILVLLLVLSAVPLVSAAEVQTEPSGDTTYTSGIYKYTVKSDGTAEITGYTGKDSVLSIPSAIDGHSVTSIGGSAFMGCTGLTSVTIPESVTSIYSDAFYGCTSLTSVTIPESVTSIYSYAFYGCTGLTSVTIPSSVTSIGDYAFHDCTGLTSVTIPESVTSIGDYAFHGCTALTAINVDENSSHYSSLIGVLFNKDKTKLVCYPAGKPGEYTIPNSVTSIGEYAFRDCTALTSVTIPGSVTSIGESAFQSCTALTSVTIPESVTSIGDVAFGHCTGLTSVTIPGSVTLIGWSAFNGCTALTAINVDENSSHYSSLIGVLFNKDKTKLVCYPAGKPGEYTIPNSVTSIGDAAFGGCTKLTAISVAENNSNYSSVNGVLFNKDKTELVCYPAGKTGEYTIPSNVTSIGWSAFEHCTGLTNVTIPNSVTSIGWSAFSGCTGLTSVTIPGSVTSISYRAFEYCTGLTSVTIPSSVTWIGDCAFWNCTGLTSVTIPGSVTSIGDAVFDGCTKLTAISVAENNSNYSSVNGVVFNKDKTELVRCPAGKSGEYTIPNSVTSIGFEAFWGCTGLTSVTIPGSVTSIDGWAFENCTGLTSITIPSSVTAIGGGAFNGCTNLTIFGNAGSYAESRTRIYNFKFTDIETDKQNDEASGISVTAKTSGALKVAKLTDTSDISAAKLLLSGNLELNALYDISFNGEAVTGSAMVKIPCTDESARVFRIESDGTATDMNAVYKDGYLTFFTEHFSKYIVATENEVLKGDVNGDGKINLHDEFLMQQYVNEKVEFTSLQVLAGDINGDGKVNLRDCYALQKQISA